MEKMEEWRKLYLVKKLVALLLLTPLVSGEDIEYPIELTCELGAQVIFINLDKEKNSVTFEQNPRMAQPKKTHKIRKVKVNEGAINIKVWSGTNPHNYNINRYNLKIDEISRGHVGQCFKGFKEYTEKQI